MKISKIQYVFPKIWGGGVAFLIDFVLAYSGRVGTLLFCGFGVSFCLQRWCGFFEIEGDFAFASAYSGGVFLKTFEGD